MSGNRLAYLFQCYFDRTATEQQKDELMELLRQAGNDEQVKYLMAETWHRLEADQKTFSPDQSKKMLLKILQDDLRQEGSEAAEAVKGREAVETVRTLPPAATPPAVTPPAAISTVLKRGWFRLPGAGLPRAAAAAAIIFLSGAGIYLLRKHKPEKRLVRTEKLTPPVSHDIPPGGNKAKLTLADGSTISLDSLQNGDLARQGNAKIVKLKSGGLAYQVAASNKPQATSLATYNILSTPPGGQYQLVLADGSKVWLNAASSLRFPTTFAGKERSVEITGEAYFEIKKNAEMPFRVKVRDAEVEVLGTSFNVMAYNNENAIKTTLLEGAVKVSKGNKSALLQPGQQAALNVSSSVINVRETDVEEAVAWKNGLFQFNSDDIGTIMRQLGRWYDVETGYEGKIPDWHFTGSIGRNIPLSKVLKMLEVNDFHFRIEGKKIIVL
jgi:transmembrane sensor